MSSEAEFPFYYVAAAGSFHSHQCGYQHHRFALRVRHCNVADEWRSRLSDGNIKYLHYAYVLRQQNRLFYGSCYDYVLDRSDSCFDFAAPDTHERLITGGG